MTMEADERGRAAPAGADQRAFAVAATLTPHQREATDPAAGQAAATGPEAALGHLDTRPSDPPLGFPTLDGADARRMEDLIASRLFPRRQAPLRIGRYLLLDRLGQGGMGVVYAAYDPDLDRKVAIKLLLSEGMGGVAEARLRREAQAMARVVHANVVSVIEVGEHEGQTYVAMEYVRGVPLSRWQETTRGWREVVGVYLQAGRGLAAAHRGGVIHRDFKPHNVMLVDAGVDVGRVKVLDFGLARASATSPIAEPAFDETTSSEDAARMLGERLTATGALMGTPAYMAPEQLAGRPPDERSDQYSFAVALYEALYGRLPYPSGSLPVIVRAILAGEIAAPPRGREVPPWIHRVLLRGLALDPGRRFESMAALCDGLERDPSARRRSAALALSLSVVVGAGGWGLAGLASESPCEGPAFELAGVWDESRASAAEAAFEATDLPYAEGTFARVRPALDTYAEGWTRLRVDGCEAHQRGERSAALYDRQMACLDRRRAGLGTLGELLTEADAEVVDHALEAALALPPIAPCGDREALLRDATESEDPAIASTVRSIRNELAAIDALRAAGRLDRAATAADEALGRATELGFRPLSAAAALTLGTIELARQRGDAADRALTIALREGLASGADKSAAEGLIRRIFVRGALLGDAARALADEELAVLMGERFADDGHLRWLLTNNLGVVHAIHGDTEGAEARLREAAAIEAGPTLLEHAATEVNLGLVALDHRDLEGALAHHQRALDLATQELGPAHPLARQYLTHRANDLVSLHRHREARADIDALLKHLKRAKAPAHVGVWPRITLARLDNQRRDFASARARAADALALADPSDRLTVANAEAALARALAGLGDLDGAKLHRERGVEEVASSLGPEHAFVATILGDAAPLSGPAAGDPAVVADLRRALAIRQQAHGDADAYTAASERALASALIAAGAPAEARTRAERALAVFDGRSGDHRVDRGLAALVLGRALLALETDAVAPLRRAVELLEPRLDPDDPDLADARAALAASLVKGDPEDMSTIAEARRLAAAAAATYRELGPAFAGELEAVEAIVRGG
ncbi:MAG: serine/threonine protein kinase [Myxococcales bacterium]|nr:serine/threonine protein kinase [Myxococcales bacterium]